MSNLRIYCLKKQEYQLNIILKNVFVHQQIKDL